MPSTDIFWNYNVIFMILGMSMLWESRAVLWWPGCDQLSSPPAKFWSLCLLQSLLTVLVSPAQQGQEAQSEDCRGWAKPAPKWLFQREVTIDREPSSPPMESRRRQHGSQERTSDRKEPHSRDNRDKKDKGKSTSAKVTNSLQASEWPEARRVRKERLESWE